MASLTARAAPVYSVFSPNAPPAVIGETLQSLSFSSDGLVILGAAGPDGAGVYVNSTGANGSVRASFSYDDFIISGPDASVVTGAINIALSGRLATLGGVPNSVAGAYVIVSGGWFEGTVNICQSTLLNNAGCGGPTIPPYYTSGILSAVTGTEAETLIDGIFTSPTHTFVPNTHFSIGLFLEVGAGSMGGTSAIADFGHTLEFPGSGPVFNLPEGYTLNSVSAGIVNNRYVGFNPPPEPTPVPEPSSLALVGIALAGLGVVRRRTWRNLA
jgi:hypothetical protein